MFVPFCYENVVGKLSIKCSLRKDFTGFVDTAYVNANSSNGRFTKLVIVWGLLIVIKKCTTVFMKSLKSILMLFILLGKQLLHLLHPHLHRVTNCPGNKTFRRCFILAPQVFASPDWQTWECWEDIVMNCLWGK